MSRRIEIELTSARPDGTWTWRAAGAREPKGLLASAILPGEPKVGDILRAEVEVELDGTTVLNASPIRSKSDKPGLLEILPSAKPFEAVTQQLAGRAGRGTRGDRGDRGDRRDRPSRGPGGDRPRTDPDRRPRRDGDRARPLDGGDRRNGRSTTTDDTQSGGPGSRDATDPRPNSAGRQRRDARSSRAGGGTGAGGTTGAGAGGSDRRDRRARPTFTVPPELPQRPKQKRLKPGRAFRNAVLADLPEAQRAVAERVLLGGVPAVRQAVVEQNVRLKEEGKEEIPAVGLIQLAEQLLPRLRVAEWLDRATAAKADLAELTLPDLRSVVASSDDPVVVRDEATRELAAELKVALAAKQGSETLLWLDDITAALGVGRVIRALKLSSQPPKAGVPFPRELGIRLAGAATAALAPDALPERWAAVLEAAAFAPVRSHIKPVAPPSAGSDELVATVKRIAPALPQIAALFGIEVAAGATMPKPIRPTRSTAPTRKSGSKSDVTKAETGKATRPPRPPKPASPTVDPPAGEVTDTAIAPDRRDDGEAALEIEPGVEPAAVEAEVEAEASVEPELEAERVVDTDVEAETTAVEHAAAAAPVVGADVDADSAAAVEPAVAVVPVVDAEPATAVEPAVGAMLVVDPDAVTEPAAAVEPAVAVVPVVDAEPATAVEPAVGAMLVVDPEPATAVEPAVGPMPVVDAEPATAVERAVGSAVADVHVVDPEPATAVEPAVGPMPVVVADGEAEPAVAAVPVVDTDVEAEPAAAVGPVVAAVPAPDLEPASSPHPDPIPTPPK